MPSGISPLKGLNIISDIVKGTYSGNRGLQDERNDVFEGSETLKGIPRLVQSALPQTPPDIIQRTTTLEDSNVLLGDSGGLVELDHQAEIGHWPSPLLCHNVNGPWTFLSFSFIS